MNSERYSKTKTWKVGKLMEFSGFNRHDKLAGKHAFLSPSNYHWIFYDNDKLTETYRRSLAVERGTRLHEFAAMSIDLGRKQPRTNDTVSMFVNDAIGYHMSQEQPLFYSDNCFGTADAISYRNKLLRIHDLKTGVTPASMHQLEVYAALFCLEYGFRPGDIRTELRIYQSDEVIEASPDPEEIFKIIEKITTFSKIIDQLKAEQN